MLLRDYRLDVAKLSREKLGRLLGVTGVSVYRWETCRSIPEAEHMRKILEVTGGQVTPNDFIGGGK